MADPGISKPAGGGGVAGVVEFLGLEFVLTPSHIPYVFVVRVVNKIQIINIVF